MTNIDQNLLVKIELLKQGVRDERKKNSELDSQIIKLKEDLVIKQEIIDKQKEELKKLRSDIKKPQLHRFITGFFDQTDLESTDENGDIIPNQNQIDTEYAYYQKENNELKEQIKFLIEEKESINLKLNEQEKTFDEQKKKMSLENESKINELKKSHELNINKIIQDYEKTISNLKNENLNKSQTIIEQNKSYKIMTELCKSFDIQKFDYEKQINNFKKETDKAKSDYDNLKNEMDLMKKEKELNDKKSEDDKEEISKLKEEINQYKLIIEELTPISKYSVLTGTLIPPEKNGIRKPIEITFGKYQNSLCIKEEGVKEKVISNKDIEIIIKDKKDENRIWICVNIGKDKKTYLCQFTKKEIKYIMKFYKEIRVKPVNVENVLMNASFGGGYFC